MIDTADIPLVVDLDGTLTPTDTLLESVVQLVKRSPSSLLLLPWWLLRGRAGFKEAIATRAAIDAERLPYNAPLLDYLREEKSRGARSSSPRRRTTPLPRRYPGASASSTRCWPRSPEAT